MPAVAMFLPNKSTAPKATNIFNSPTDNADP